MTDADYPAAMEELNRLVDLDPEEDPPDGMRLVALCEEIAAYERARYPFEPPTAEEAAAFRREQEGKP
jgi:antitoxin component HigA of HigAB toxin-antitoxin module